MTTKIKHIANNVITDSQINLSTIDSGEIAEGSNLYFTDARVDSRLSGGSVGAISHSQGYTQTAGTWQKQGTNGNITIASTGNDINFSRNSANYLNATGASASLVLMTASTAALTLNSSQDAVFAGDVTINGQLSLVGNIDQYNVTDLDVTDKTITLGSGQIEANSGGSGIIIDGSAASMLWDEANDEFDFNKGLNTAGTLKVSSYDTELASGHLRFKFNGGAYIDNNTTGQSLNFRVSNSSSIDTTAITINSAGNVGVGVTSIPAWANLMTNGTVAVGGTLYMKAGNPIQALSGFPGGASNLIMQSGGGKIIVGDTASHTTDLLQIETPASGGGHGIQIRRNDANNDQNVGHILFGNNTVTDLVKVSAKTDEDSNAGDSGALLFSTKVTNGNLTERMRIDSSGNVGIGTTDPTTQLHMKHASGPTLMMTRTSTNTSGEIGKIVFGNADWDSSMARIVAIQDGTNDGARLEFKTQYNATQAEQIRMVIKKDGKVGIFQPNPQTALHVKFNTQHQLRLEGDNSYWNIGTGWSGYWQDYLLIATNTGEKMVITSAGSVGIGTNNPVAKLQVEGNIRMNTPDGGGAPAMTSTLEMRGYEGRGVGIKMKDSVNSSTSANDREWFVGTGYGTSSFGVGYASDGSQSSYTAQNKLTISSTGNVGIGTTNPVSLLSVHGDGIVTRMDGTANTSRTLLFRNVGTAEGIVRTDGNMHFLQEDASRYIRFSTANQERMRIKSDGTKVTNNVKEYYERIFLTNSVAYNFDIDVKSIGASGQILEVFAGYTHYSTTYGAVIKQVWSQRSTAQSDVVIINNTVNHSTSQAGAWTFSYVDADTVRLTKSAGTYGGSGYGYILIRSPD